MGLLHSFQQWRAARHAKHISRMKEENKCPDCYGRGFVIYPANEFTFFDGSYDCPGCDGSGLFTDWTELS